MSEGAFTTMTPATPPSDSRLTTSEGGDPHPRHLPSAPSGPTRPATPAQASATRTGAPPAAGPDRPRASGTPGWWLPVALLLGIGHAFTFAPWGHGWLQLLVLTGFSLLLGVGVQRRLPTGRLGLAGLAFGIGWFAAGVGWVYVSMHEHGGMPALLSGAAVLLFALYLGLYPALAAALVGRLARPGGALRFILVMAGCFCLAELARGWVLTGFPWLGIGYAQIDTPLAGLAPVGGVYLVGLATVMAAASLAQALLRRQPAWLLLPALLLATGFGLQQVGWSQPVGQPIGVSLLQGNVPQQLKFDAGFAARTRQQYLQMIEAAPADLIVLPETAWTMPWDRSEAALRARMASFLASTGSAVALGSPRLIVNPDPPANDPMQGLMWTNSVVLLDGGQATADGLPSALYDKRHLVPFGEFVPPGARWFVDLMKIPLGDQSRGAPRQPPFRIRDQHVSFNICYEDIFGEELLASLHDGATILANVTNLGWFGQSHALPQHLQIARMRALETARPMIRATNTGTTAIIDATGALLAQLPVHQQGSLQAQVQGRTGLTPYARAGGNLPVLIAALLLTLLGTCLPQMRGREVKP